MKNINIAFEDEEFEELKKKKGDRGWKEMLQQSPMTYIIGSTIPHGDKDTYKFVKSETMEMRNIGSDSIMPIPVKPNQIVVYTVYTLEKVE